MKVTNAIFVSAFVIIQLIGSVQIVTAHPKKQIISDLPPAVISDILSILLTGTVNLVGNCTPDISGTKIEYWMYNRENPNGYLMTNFDGVDYTKGVLHFLIHGWGDNKDVDSIKLIRNAYLQKFDFNVITIDYGYYVNSDYVSSYCNLPVVANSMSQFFCQLNQHLDLSKLHVVGHSVGAQLAGMASYKVREQCQLSIGRITGLDPAGPVFQGLGTKDRLDATDADFVDVIHTNQGQLGYVGNLGDIDFYPNCGNFQPGCLAIVNSVTLATITNLPMSYIQCNHHRSCLFFAESILRNSFFAVPVWEAPLCLVRPANPSDRVYMGEYCYEPHKSRSYYMRTNANSPYGVGPVGPMN